LAGRPTPARTAREALTGLDQAVGLHRVEVLADGGGAQAQLRAQLDGGGMTPLEQQLGHPVAGATVGVATGRPGRRPDRPPNCSRKHRVFHYPNVT
jgi:hypothetical protein